MLTVRENLEFFAGLHGLARATAGEALCRVGLERAAEQRAGELSRGMQQRLALARATLHGPELLILDEPDASLDVPGRSLLAELVENRTVVLATHDRTLARRLCTRALLLRGGLAAGDPWRLVVLEEG